MKKRQTRFWQLSNRMGVSEHIPQLVYLSTMHILYMYLFKYVVSHFQINAKNCFTHILLLAFSLFHYFFFTKCFYLIKLAHSFLMEQFQTLTYWNHLTFKMFSFVRFLCYVLLYLHSFPWFCLLWSCCVQWIFFDDGFCKTVFHVFSLSIVFFFAHLLPPDCLSSQPALFSIIVIFHSWQY